MEYRLGALNIDDAEFGHLAVEGDGFSAAGELVTIVGVPGVQQQLGLSPAQVTSLAAAVRDYRDAVSTVHADGRPPDADRERRVAQLHTALLQRAGAIVGTPALTRMRALSWRIRNGDALFDADVAAALGLIAPQREQLERARQENRQAAAAAMRAVSGARFTTAESFAQHATAAHAPGDARLLAVLTPQQRAAFERMKRGEPA